MVLIGVDHVVSIMVPSIIRETCQAVTFIRFLPGLHGLCINTKVNDTATRMVEA